MTLLEDHLFRVEVDIIKFDQDSDRVIINGYLGDKIETQYTGEHLMLQGSEASISLKLSLEELHELIKNMRARKAAPELLKLFIQTDIPRFYSAL